ncbi:MAG TPA: DUF4142 domain-containing protein [Advenella sp.]|nr:DUF4142 domain-containing protein [Advenella sp.]
MLSVQLKNMLFISALCMAPATASAQSTNPATDMKPETATRPHENELSGSDESFLNNAAQAGLAEIAGAKLAQKKATSDQVKDFAAKMIADHTKVNDELKALATNKGVTVSTEPSMAQKAELQALEILDDTFDKNYVDRLAVAAHESTIALFRKTAEKGEDVDVKSFAKAKLPSLEAHLNIARSLQTATNTDK